MTHEYSCHHEAPGDSGDAFPPVRPEETIADLVHHRTGVLKIMKEIGINHCCGAHLTLREAPAAVVPLDVLLAALNESRAAPP